MSLYITDESGKLHKIAGAGGASGVVDDALNPDSENPVQNKVLYNPVSFAEDERQKSKNLFDKDNATIYSVYINVNSNAFIYASVARSVVLEIKPNTTYTVSKIASARFVIGTSVLNPNDGVAVTNSIVGEDSDTHLTITSGANDKYLLIFCYHTTDDTVSLQTILNSLQVEYGAVATDYQPYNGKILREKDIYSWVSLENPLNVNTISSNYVAVDISSVVDQFVEGAEYEVMTMWGIDGALIASGTIVVSVYTDLLGSATGAITIFTDPSINTRRNISIMPCKRYLYYKTSDVANTYGLYMRVYAYRRIK